MSNSAYFQFLCKKLGANQYQYKELLKILYNTEFYSLVDHDENRAVDGEIFREQFIDMVGPQGSSCLPRGSCTVLEMLLGLANRMEFDLSETVSHWFWILIENLELYAFTDEEFLYRSEYCTEEINQVLHFLLERDYSYNGCGGLFPLADPKQNQTQVELWYQMSYWINENYPV